MIKAVENKVGLNATAPVIEEELKTVCGVLPGFLDKVCIIFVEQNKAALVNFVQSNVDPTVACQDLGVCPKTPSTEEVVVEEEECVSSIHLKCPLCKAVIKAVEEQVGRDATPQEVEASLEKVCHHLPSIFGSICTIFVQENFNKLEAAIQANATPAVACHDLHACK